jgi:formamidopyrimidine-DNA glycosylase
VPELPDVELYLHCLDAVEGRTVHEVRRLGKRVVLALDGDLFLVVHPMIAGRFRWHDAGPEPPALGSKIVLAAMTFPPGTLVLTEAGTKKRASMHVVRGAPGLAAHDRGGLEPLESDGAAFAERLRSESHTLKRALTDPRLFSGIGNAYSDEILHRARLSPITLTRKLDDDEVSRLHEAVRTTLVEWTDRLVDEIGDGFPGPRQVTAFRAEMAVHGRYGQPCPACGAPVQRIVYASNETNYCAPCQTDGVVLKDRSLSRLLRDDWPRTIEEMDDAAGA